VEHGDIVVFNYPGGDSVALKVPEEGISIRLAYKVGTTGWQAQDGAPVIDMDKLSPQRPAKDVRACTIPQEDNAILNDPEPVRESRLARPVDHRENYVKRCIGLPGDVLHDTQPRGVSQRDDIRRHLPTRSSCIR
jgi:signal peptidase I